MLEARGLTKNYNHAPAVRQVSFAIAPGEILGYLGPNGAGKSTTVKMLVGLIEPSEGQIFYQGRSVYEDFAGFQRKIGYVPEEPHLYSHLSGREYLQLVGRLRGMPREVLDPKMDEFLKIFGLAGDSHRPVASYSKGMRQKVLLSAALLHDPEILILDEPFSGLDVTSALMLRSLLRALAAQGKIIFYSSHVLEVVEKVCSTVLILRKGEVVAYDSIERLRELMSQPSLEGVFAQLANVDDGEETAQRVVAAMKQPEANGHNARPVALGMRAYRAIAGALPEEFRNDYGDELVQTAEDAMEPVWRHDGVKGLARMLLDVALRVPGEYLSEVRQNVRYGLRALRGSPGFTAIAMLSLMLGICIATCAYSEMNGLLRDLPGVRAPDELVALSRPVSYPEYRQYRELHGVFSDSFAYVAPVPLGVSLGGGVERMWGQLASASYFSTLGVRPMLGRFLQDSDDLPGGVPPVVISYRLWADRLSSDSSIVGKTLTINGFACTVIGVGGTEFRGASPTRLPADLWLPLSVDGRLAPEMADHALERRDLTMFQVVGRLRPGVGEERAKAELSAAGQRLAQSYGEYDRNPKAYAVELVQGGKMLPVAKRDLPFFRDFFLILGGLVLLIACANVANMMLSRAAARRKEISVRLALGAGRGRLVRQLLTESMLLAMGAALPAFLLAWWLMTLASRMKMPLPIPIALDLAPDWRAAVFTLALTGITGLAFGLAPALQATRTDLVSALKEGGLVRLRKYRALSLRNFLVFAQLAASLMLLLLTGYLGLGIQSTLGVQEGFDPTNLYLVSLDPSRAGYSGSRAGVFFAGLLDRVKVLPGVRSACLTDTVPVAMDGNPGVRFGKTAGNEIAGSTRAQESGRRHEVGRDYFETAGIRILAGRSFRQEDEQPGRAVVVVSREAVVRLWKGADPVGQRIEVTNDAVSAGIALWPGTFDYRASVLSKESREFEVIGVAADVSEDLVASKKHAAIYFPLHTGPGAQPSLRGLTLMVRTAPGVEIDGAVRREIAALDPAVTPFHARSMTEQIRQFMSTLQGASWTYGVVGLFGLILASVGVAGVTAYSVAKRRHEIGVRIALGAQQGDVLRLVMKEGAVLVVLGTMGGLAMAWAGMRALARMFFTVASVRGADPVLLLGAPLLLAGLALAACYLPARRIAGIDPVAALREE